MKIQLEADEEFMKLLKDHLKISEEEKKLTIEKHSLENKEHQARLDAEIQRQADLMTLTPKERLEFTKKGIF